MIALQRKDHPGKGPGQYDDQNRFDANKMDLFDNPFEQKWRGEDENSL